ncbi:MAG: XTP/dITP diphosphatase [Deltaproteobacteria bacterium]|nr:XTP/dITP diphosphatase [Deltaproteobacteria bacterium]
MNIVLATANPHKLKEFQQILAADNFSIVPLSAFPGCPDVVEDGDSFEENALKKARAICSHTGCVAMADDSGLEVDALNGAPGIYSARFAGEPRSDGRNIALLLERLHGAPPEQRGAQFRCVIAVVAPGGRELVVQGLCRGRITEAPVGSGGFGYDPVFLHEPSGRTFAELPAKEKNSLSHRGRAAAALRELLPEFLKSLQADG